MKSQEIARRYAEALYDLGREEGIVDALEAAYGRIVEELYEIPDAVRFLEHPLIPREKKRAFIDAAFPGISRYLRNFLHLLVKNGRAGYIRLIYDQFRTLRGERERIARVEVATAKPLSQKEQAKLSVHLEAALGKRVELKERVDPSLLGGARLELDGKVIDGTLWAKLAQLKSVLAG